MATSSVDPSLTAPAIQPMIPSVSTTATETLAPVGKMAGAHEVIPLSQTAKKGSLDEVSANVFTQLGKLALTSDEEGFKAGQAKLTAEVGKLKEGKIEAYNHWTSVAGRVLLVILTLTVIFSPLTIPALLRGGGEIKKLDDLRDGVASMTKEGTVERARAELQKNSTVFQRKTDGLRDELSSKMRTGTATKISDELSVPAYIVRDNHRARHIAVSIKEGGKVSVEPSTIPEGQKKAVVDSFYEELLHKFQQTEKDDKAAKNIVGNLLAATTGNILVGESTSLLVKPQQICTNMPPQDLDPELRKSVPPPMTNSVVVHVDDKFCHQTVMEMFQVGEVIGGDLKNVKYRVLISERHIPMEVMRANPEDLVSGKVKMEGMVSVAAHSPEFATQAEALAYLKQASQIAKSGPLIKKEGVMS